MSYAGATLGTMAKDDKPRDLIGYEALQQEAMRGVVRAALERAIAPGGLPGEHHFYVSFRTEAPGVSMPEDLATRYPDEMTVVLQNQFWDLAPGEAGFSVTLQFGGQPKSLTIPYAAVTRFYDPSVQFMLQFPPPAAGAPPRPAAARKPMDRSDEEGPKVVSLDQFRKK
jgi:hypothetical protein